MASPPAFQEAERCDVCSCTFTTFKRRHHCRCCGRTLCHEHSSNYMALPQFRIYSDVRVCSECFTSSARFQKDGGQTSEGSIHFGDATSDCINLNAELGSQPNINSLDCKCGMPLCICEAPKVDPSPLKNNSKPKKVTNAQQVTGSISKKAHSSTSKSSPFYSLSHSVKSNLNEACMNYEESGEGLREAIKNNDASTVKKLLSKGIDSNYCDKQGLTLLHLAALFNRTEIVFILMDHGASLESKNAQGETALDCAPPMLQHKMLEKSGGSS